MQLQEAEHHAGYHEGLEQGTREALEFAVLRAIRRLGADEVRATVEHLVDTRRPMFVKVR